MSCVAPHGRFSRQVRRAGAELFFVYGRIGSDGTKTRKVFGSEALAGKELERLAASKLRKGYVRK